jgi:polysaccharide biosynthesis transport protein
MSSETQQITPFDGYGNDVAELGQSGYAAGAGGGGVGGYGSNTALARPGPVHGSSAMTGYDPMGMGGGGHQQGAVFKKIHQSLRGRYLFAVFVGLILGVAGGYAGYKSQKPLYRGEALIQIRANVRNITDTGFIPNFDELLQSEALTVSSRAMIRNAMRLAEWEGTGLATDGDAQVEVAENLTAEHPTRTEYIRLYYANRNPDVAVAVVTCITKAYQKFFQDRAKGDEYTRLTTLATHILTIEGQIKNIEEKIVQIARQYGTDNLDAIRDAKFEQDNKLELQLRQAEFALESAKNKQDAKQVILNLNVEKIGMLDPGMREHLFARNAIKNQIEELKERGVMSENQLMKQLVRKLELKQLEIDRYAAEWRDTMKMWADEPSLAQGGMARLLALSPAVLENEVNYIRKRYQQLHAEYLEVGQRAIDLKELIKQREDKAKEKLDAERKQEVILLDAKMGSRLNIIDFGTVSNKPFKDRRKLMGVAGAMFGFGLPMGIFVLMGLMNRRYLYTDDAGEYAQNVPLLGILPRLPDKLTDPEQAAVAAHCIHQIRIMLQVGADPESRRVFMITSASTGDGKTSLTMALGLSFAASGSKTLVIDCDMVGQGLTHRLKAHHVPGLIETLNLGTLRGHVRKTATKGLYVLPIGNADAMHAGVLSPQSIKRLLVACREHFDVIIIDTGPILGSLEASVVAPEADGVVLAVARGQQQPMVEKAVKMLRNIGGKVLGIVFNRAEQRDFQRSVASASMRSLSARPHETRALLPESDESSRFGPLARSVASWLPSSSSGSVPANGNGNGHASNGNGAANGNAPGNGSNVASTTVESRG